MIRVSQGSSGNSPSIVQQYSSANLVPLGANTAGDLLVWNLDPRTVVRNCFLEVTSPANGVSTLVCSVGRVAPDYEDYIQSSDLKTLALYGGTASTRGVNLSMYDIPSISAVTPIYLRLISTGGNLNSVTNLEFKVTLKLDKLE